MKSYSIHYHKYNIFANNYVRYIQDVVTDDIYHEVGKIICSSLERISKISYTLNKNGITQEISDIRYKCGFTNSYEFVEDKDMWERYSNRCQHIYKRDYCIDNPKDYVYSYDFLKRYNKAKKEFLMLSVKFLDAMGKEREAREIEKAINTYIPDKFAERIINLNMQFIARQKRRSVFNHERIRKNNTIFRF